MRRLITPWREIVRDFSWPLLALFLVYSVAAIAIEMQGTNPSWLREIIMSLIRLAAWLTIIAVLVPQNGVPPIFVRRPLPELVFLCLWGVADAIALIYYWDSVSSSSPASMVQIASVLGRFALAILFARIFRYSAPALGSPFKHWRLYLFIIVVSPIIIMTFSAIMRALPSVHFPFWILHEQYFNLGVGVFWVLVLFVLYLSNHERWQGLADDLKSIYPYALPIILCAFVSVGLVWFFRDRSQIQWSLPLRAFDTITMVQGAMPEEFYYRFGLQTHLTPFMPFGWASLLQGIAFSASHFPRNLAMGYLRTGDLLWSFTPGIVNAIAGGYFWYRSENLPATILFHMAVFI